MSRFLYEKSVSYKGHLIIPFVFGIVDGNPIYSYALLSEWGHKGKFNKSENPVAMHSGSISDIIAIAKSHLDENSDVVTGGDYFKSRYTYRGDMIIIYQLAAKYFYDHYKSDSLNNVAAPRLFASEQECIGWVKEGLDRSRINEEVERGG